MDFGTGLSIGQLTLAELLILEIWVFFKDLKFSLVFSMWPSDSNNSRIFPASTTSRQRFLPIAAMSSMKELSKPVKSVAHSVEISARLLSLSWQGWKKDGYQSWPVRGLHLLELCGKSTIKMKRGFSAILTAMSVASSCHCNLWQLSCIHSGTTANF